MEKFIIAEIAKETARCMGVPVKILRSPSRKAEHVRARSVAIYLSRKKTDATLEEIGFVFNRNHGSVLHSINMVQTDRRLIAFAKIINERIANLSVQPTDKSVGG